MAHRPGPATPKAASAGDPQAPPGATPRAKSRAHCCHTKTSLTPEALEPHSLSTGEPTLAFEIGC